MGRELKVASGDRPLRLKSLHPTPETEFRLRFAFPKVRAGLAATLGTRGEMREFLRRYEIDYDERYVWD